MVKIAPSILSANFLRLGDEVRAAEDAGADIIHIDVMDGHFVPNLTIGYSVVAAVRKVTKLPLDVHLMIDAPERYLTQFIDAGSDFLTVHAEASVHLHRTIQAIKERGIKAGASLNPATPFLHIDDILPDIDLLLVMSVNPGFGGQKFIPSALDKIRTAKKRIQERSLSVLIEVDGGVKIDNAREVADAGADILVMGSAFFESGDYRAFVKKVHENLVR